MHAGNLVKVNDAPMVVINQVDAGVRQFRRAGAAPGVRSARLSAGRKLRGDRPSPTTIRTRTARGALSLIDNTVDTNTGTIQLKATFDNRDARSGRGSSLRWC